MKMILQIYSHVTKKMEEMMEMNQGQGRGGMQMRMGR